MRTVEITMERSSRHRRIGYQVDASTLGRFAWQGLIYCGAAVLLAAVILGGIWFMKHTEHGMMIVMFVCAVTGIVLFLTMRTEEKNGKPCGGTGGDEERRKRKLDKKGKGKKRYIRAA